MKKSTAILIFAAAVCLSSCGHDIADFKPVSEPERASSQEVIDIPESDTDDSADTPADAPDDVPAEPENGETPDEQSGEDEKPEEKESKENKDSSSKESSSSKVLIKTGVWWATSESDDFYYEVQKDGGGMMLKQEDGLGWAVQYKQKKPEKITMAFANGITQKADIEYISDDKIKHRYLLAHEVAHWIIKRDSLIDDLSYYACSKSISKRINIINTTSMMNYMNNYPGAYSEMLADGIANSLLMPAETFVPLAKKFMKELGFTDSKVFFGERLKETDELVCKLASQYLVPEFAVKNHLFALGLYDVR